MNKITLLQRQAHRRDRVSVFIDEEYAFGLQEGLAATLFVGQEITPDEVRHLKEEDQVERGYVSVLGYLAHRPRSAAEIERYLGKKELRPDQIERVLNRLKRANLVDDQEFARLWVENRETFRPRGCLALRQELREKGVEREAIETAIDAVDEEESALRAGESRVRRLAHLDRETFHRRLFSFLQRRGFGYAISRKVTERLWRQVGARPEVGSD